MLNHRILSPLQHLVACMQPLEAAPSLRLHWFGRILFLTGAPSIWLAGRGDRDVTLVLLAMLLVLGEFSRWHTGRWRQMLQEARANASLARRRLQGVVECLPEAFALYDQHDRLTLCNPQYARFFSPSMKTEDLVGRSYVQMKQLSLQYADERPEDGYDNSAWIEERIRRHRAGESFVLRLGEQYFLAIDYPVPDIGIVSMRLNVSMLKQQEKALSNAKCKAEAASRAKSAFLTMVSHEIRTPFNGLLGWLELLRATRLSVRQSAMLANIHDSAATLLRLMDDILDFSAIEEGKIALEPTATDIRSLLAEMHQLFAPVAAARGFCCELVIAPEVAGGHLLDARRLRQILVNFLSNAFQSTASAHGDIRLALDVLSTNGGQQLLRFSCTGSGCDKSPEMCSRMSPLNPGEDEPRTGVGFAMSLCQRLAELMGGCAGFYCDPQGGVCSWLSLRLDCVSLPQALGEGAAAVNRLEFAGHAPVLLVEDHPCNRQLMAMQLTRLGVPCRLAEHGEEALALWRSEPFSLILSDCHMPVMDGYQLARAIREEEAAQMRPPLPIIACTANQAPDALATALQAGMSHVLTKPIDMPTLASTLSHWLRLPMTAPSLPRCRNHPACSGRPFDREMLSAISRGNRLLAWRLVSVFAAAGAEDCRSLRQAIAEQDNVRVAWHAHRIKGSARAVGASGVAEAAAKLERAAREASPLADPWGALQGGLAELEAWIAGQPGLMRRAVKRSLA